MTSGTRIRAASALIAVGCLVAIIRFGGYVGIAVAAFFVCLMALNEYGHMILHGPRYKNAHRYFVGLGLISYTISIYRNDWLLHSIVLSTLFILMIFLLLAKDETVPIEELVNKAGLCFMGILYAGVCPVYITLLTRLSEHLEWFIFTLVVVFAGDTTAYFVGRKYGRTKLFQRISPNKSVEGAIGSLFASVITGLIVRRLFLRETDLFMMFSLCILTSIVAQTGDLCESMIKRSFHAKDSGSLMPGHGGLLDRLDGILFGAPLVYIYAKYLVLP